MCGLFGYCFSEKQKEKLTNEKVRELVRLGVNYNLHRGTDAAGWAAAYPDKRKEGETEASVWFHKKNGPGHEKLLNSAMPEDVPTSLLVHTRAGTMGSPKDEENNHPVIHGHVLTTHNGTVSNHREFRSQFSDQLAEIVPEPVVDSWVLSVILKELYPDPDQTEDLPQLIREGLGRVEGGYAYASLYATHPDWALVSRGRGSPLVMAYHADKGFMYASEADALMRATEVLDDSKWEFKTVDEGRLFVVYRGQIVESVSYKHRAKKYHTSYGASTKTDPTRKRVLLIDQDRAVQDNSYWNNKHWSEGKAPLSVFEVDAEDKNFRWVEPRKWGSHLTSSTFQTVGDATAIGFYELFSRKGDNDNRTYVLWALPDSNVVFEHVYEGDGFKLLDVYAHDRNKMLPVANRWRDVEKPKVVEAEKPDDEYAVENFKFSDYWQGASEVKPFTAPEARFFQPKKTAHQKVGGQLPLRSNQGEGTGRNRTTGLGSRSITHRVGADGQRPGFMLISEVPDIPFPHGRCKGILDPNNQLAHDPTPHWMHGTQWLLCEDTRYAVLDLIEMFDDEEQWDYTGAIWTTFDDGLSELYKDVTCIDQHDWESDEYADGLCVSRECGSCGAMKVLVGFNNYDLARYVAEIATDWSQLVRGAF